ncbi:MAG: ABC transporter substrate-binding protein [Dehalococcoidia bacterium]|nr:Glutathione-binding protein GsiB [Chloroflexota bacterium]
MLNKKMISLIICVLLLCTMLAGCVEQQAEEVEVEVPQEVVAGLSRDAGDSPRFKVNPYLTGILETLVILDEKMEPQPWLAKSWNVSEDGLTWTLYLREGVYFHDGTPFNADAVKVNIERIEDERPGFLGELQSIEVIDDYVIKFTHSEPFAPFIETLAWGTLFAIVSPNAIDEKGNIIEPIGTGAFKFYEHVPDDRLVMVRNEDYWGGIPKLEKITLKSIPDHLTRIMALEAGEVDLITCILPEHASILINDPEITMLIEPSSTSHFLIFNNNRTPFDDVRVRQAVRYAINTETMVEHAMEGFGIVGMGITPPNIESWFHPEIGAPEFNPEKSRELLQEAGWVDIDGDGMMEKDGEKFKVRFALNTLYLAMYPHLTMAEIIQAQLSDVGIEVELIVLERGAYFDGLRAGELEMCFDAFPFLTGEPDFVFYRSFHSEGDWNPRFGMFYNNPRVDELLELGKTTTNFQERREIYHEIEEIIVDEVPLYTLMYGKNIDAIRNHVQGSHRHSIFGLYWADVYLLKR